MRNFKELLIWQESMKIVKEVYQLTKRLPTEERFGVATQMQRAAVSISSNIAEGCSRKSQKDYRRILEIALGSAFELETQLLVTVEVGYLKKDELDHVIQLINKEQKMPNSFIKTVEKSQKPEN
jgi:four helix bundle protein